MQRESVGAHAAPLGAGARRLVATLGVAVVALFFLPWLRDVGFFELSGLAIADLKTTLFVIPLGGLVLVAAGVWRGMPRALVAVAGLAIVSVTSLAFLRWAIEFEPGMVVATLGAGFVLLGDVMARRWIRIAAGLAMAASFWLTWRDTLSGFDITHRPDCQGGPNPVSWAILVAGGAAAASGLLPRRAGRVCAWLGATGAIAIICAFVAFEPNTLIGTAAWLTLGCGIAALAIGLVPALQRRLP